MGVYSKHDGNIFYMLLSHDELLCVQLHVIFEIVIFIRLIDKDYR